MPLKIVKKLPTKEEDEPTVGSLEVRDVFKFRESPISSEEDPDLDLHRDYHMVVGLVSCPYFQRAIKARKEGDLIPVLNLNSGLVQMYSADSEVVPIPAELHVDDRTY